MELDITFLKNMLNMSKNSFSKLELFLPELHEILLKYDDQTKFTKLINKKINKKYFLKTKINNFVTKHNDLLLILVKNNMLESMCKSVLENFSSFSEIYNLINKEYDKKDEMIKNIQYFIRFGARSIVYDNLEQLVAGYQTSCSISSFSTDGELTLKGTFPYNGMEANIFEVKNANYVLTFERNSITNVKSNIKVYIKSLVFKKSLPTYNVLYSLDKINNEITIDKLEIPKTKKLVK